MRKIAAIVAVTGALALIAGCSSSGGSTAGATAAVTDTPVAAVTTPSTNSKVSRGLGLKDASADVKIGRLKSDGFGLGEVSLTVTNHSSKRSDYVIDVAIESADGKDQLGTGTALVTDLDPGQRTHTSAMVTDLPNKVPAAAKVILKTVQRNESF